jgi:hypothetical protein
MRKLAMVLALAFTMGLAASTVMAAPKDKKAKTECTKGADKKECTKKEAKACCNKAANGECPAKKK